MGLQRRLVFERLDPPVQRVLDNENGSCDTNAELPNDSTGEMHKTGWQGHLLTAFLRVRSQISRDNG